MKNMMKKTIVILLSLMMVVCLAACGNSADQAESPFAEENSAENAADGQTEDSAQAESNVEDSAADSAQTEDSAADGAQDSAEGDVQTQGSDTQAEQETSETQGSKVLVAYFSATGTTEGVAEHIANGLNADLYEIVPEEPYTDADLNYNDNNSRSTIEMNDSSSRPAISGSVENMEQYEIVFIGYPIWWGEAPRIVSTFVESYDFSGKTVVPFCTSGGSGVGSSATNLEQLTDGAAWMEGRRLNGSDSQETVMEWVNGLGLNLGE